MRFWVFFAIFLPSEKTQNYESDLEEITVGVYTNVGKKYTAVNFSAIGNRTALAKLANQSPLDSFEINSMEENKNWFV